MNYLPMELIVLLLCFKWEIYFLNSKRHRRVKSHSFSWATLLSHQTDLLLGQHVAHKIYKISYRKAQETQPLLGLRER